MPNYKANAAFRERNYPALHKLSAVDRVVVPFLPEPLPCVPGKNHDNQGLVDVCWVRLEDRMAHVYLIRYGLMAQVGKFSADSADFERGTTVVIRSHRGTELGEVLAPLPSASSEDESLAPARVLRTAGPDDLEQARQAESTRPGRFELCQRLFQDGVWPMELIDVEPLLDERRTVLHYLGPHRLDVTGLLSAFRSTYDLDVMLEPVGRDMPDEEEAGVAADDGGCGSCGSEGGGCGSSGGGCGTGGGSSHGGCSDCGVKKLIAGSRRSAAR